MVHQEIEQVTIFETSPNYQKEELIAIVSELKNILQDTIAVLSNDK